MPKLLKHPLMRYECPYCKYSVKAEELAGKTFYDCPNCQTRSYISVDDRSKLTKLEAR